MISKMSGDIFQSQGTPRHIQWCRNVEKYLRAGRRFLDIAQLALVSHSGSLIPTELNVALSCRFVEPPLTIRTLD